MGLWDGTGGRARGEGGVETYGLSGPSCARL